MAWQDSVTSEKEKYPNSIRSICVHCFLPFTLITVIFGFYHRPDFSPRIFIIVVICSRTQYATASGCVLNFTLRSAECKKGSKRLSMHFMFVCDHFYFPKKKKHNNNNNDSKMQSRFREYIIEAELEEDKEKKTVRNEERHSNKRWKTRFGR